MAAAMQQQNSAAMQQSQNPVLKIMKGRRIINVAYVIKQLRCTKCNDFLHFEHIEVETTDGLASIFYIRCRKCFSVNEVKSSREYSGTFIPEDPLVNIMKGYRNRMFDMGYVPKQLHCKKCQEFLHLEHIQKEIVVGHASIFDISCSKCLTMNEIKTSEEYVDRLTGMTLFTVNRDVALGMIGIEMSEEHIHMIWGVMSLPPLHPELLKMHKELIENEARVMYMQQMATKQKALKPEKQPRAKIPKLEKPAKQKVPVSEKTLKQKLAVTEKLQKQKIPTLENPMKQKILIPENPPKQRLSVPENFPKQRFSMPENLSKQRIPIPEDLKIIPISEKPPLKHKIPIPEQLNIYPISDKLPRQKIQIPEQLRIFPIPEDLRR